MKVNGERVHTFRGKDEVNPQFLANALLEAAQELQASEENTKRSIRDMKIVSLLTSIFVIGILLIITTGFEDDKTGVEEAKKPEAPEGMVLIPAGEFLMGSNNYKDEEKPVHKVYVDAFYMDIHEVTVGEYKTFVDATGYQPLRSVVATYSTYR